MTPAEFIKKWKPVALTERAAAHTHFLDLCKLFEHDDPVSADPTGEWFAFEKGATKTGGGEGFADVWKKNFFAWEYKKKKRDLNAAMEQLVRYAAALENPPLQVVCDTDRFIIRTAWTNTVPKQFEIELDDLALPEKREILWAVFHDPERLRPKETRAGVTKEAADKFSTIALRLQGRGTPEEVAHFVNQLVFCFFANSVKLLPEGFFPKLLKRAGQRPDKAQEYFNALFEAMEHGGEFDLTDIAHFNGGLFDGRRAIRLDDGDIGLLVAAGSLDWSLIDPTIFGTLFERFLDPDKRAQIGAHYTDPDKIMMIVEPVILRPLRAEWAAARTRIEALLHDPEEALNLLMATYIGVDDLHDEIVEIQRSLSIRLQLELFPELQRARRKRSSDNTRAELRAARDRVVAARRDGEAVRQAFVERLRSISILDPACGSGNFLYLALQGVKDIELKANLECEALGLVPHIPVIGPEIVHGIEINPLASELARTTTWIGDIQWRIRNGIHANPQPILRKLEAIECRDALVTRKPDGSFIEAEWPAAEFIVGNPPFLGSRKMKPELGERYVKSLRKIYENRVPNGADLVCYWFAKSWTATNSSISARVGLVATNSIAGGASRRVLEPIANEKKLFVAWRDEPWIVEGAAVRVAIICFASSQSFAAELDGKPVGSIFADLHAPTSDQSADLTRAKRLVENRNISFQGVVPRGSLRKKEAEKFGLATATFVLSGDLAREMLQQPENPNGHRNSDVVVPFLVGDDITGRPLDRFVVDFGSKREVDSALYEMPFAYIQPVRLHRAKMSQPEALATWWMHWRSRPEMRAALSSLRRFIATSRVAKYRLFVWRKSPTLADNAAVVIARDDNTSFGILNSKFHEAWSFRRGTRLGVGNDPRYTPTTTFETFPFPEGLTPNIPAKDYENDSRAQAIAKAAKRLDELRNAWLNPPDLVKIEPEVVPGYPDRILPKDAQAAVTLKTRTLTNLYNQRPQWLVDAHRDLDAAVAAAYGWAADISEEDALAKLLELNLARAGAAQEPGEETDDEN